jgi:hypothetical protein
VQLEGWIPHFVQLLPSLLGTHSEELLEQMLEVQDTPALCKILFFSFFSSKVVVL